MSCKAHTAPGKSDREGISLVKLMRMFPNDDAARRWFEKQIWPHGPHCPKCGSFNAQSNIKHKTMTHRCRDCDGRLMFSLKTGNIMEGSKLGYQTWAIAIYLVTISLKGVSSMRLHRDLEITQKTAWHLAHRIRKAMADGTTLPFFGPVEADETYIGGKRKNMPNRKRKKLTGRGAVGKTAVVGAKDRETNAVAARKVARTDAPHIAGFVAQRTAPGAKSIPMMLRSTPRSILGTSARRSITAPGSMSGVPRTRTGWSRSGPCSSAAIRAPSTTSRRSTPIATSRSFPGGTTSARPTPPT